MLEYGVSKLPESYHYEPIPIEEKLFPVLAIQ